MGYLRFKKRRFDGTLGSAQQTDVNALEVAAGSHKAEAASQSSFSSSKFADMQLNKNKRRDAAIAQQRQARQRRVVLYRKYRDGELPDIQIKMEELVQPLRVLCVKDPSVAKHVMATVAARLYQSLGEGGDMAEAAVAAARAEIRGRIEAALERTAASTGFVSCLLSACLATMEPGSQAPPMSLRPSVVAAASERSQNHATGIRLIEEHLLRGEAGEAGEEDARDTWMHLYSLYRSLGEADLMQGLVAITCKVDHTAAALSKEIAGELGEAVRLYNEAMVNYDNGEYAADPPATQEVERWELGSLAVQQTMGSWEQLETSVYNVAQEDEGELEALAQNDRSSQLLPYMVRALLYSEKHAQLQRIVTYLQDQEPLVLAQMYVQRGDTPHARVFIDRCFDDFVRSWTELHPLALSARQSHLQWLQLCVELDDFVTLTEQPDRARRPGPVRRVLERWHARAPSPELDPMLVWHGVVHNRNYCLSFLEEQLQAGGDEEEEGASLEVQALLRRERAEVCLIAAEAGVRQRILPFARLYTKKFTEFGLRGEEFMLRRHRLAFQHACVSVERTPSARKQAAKLQAVLDTASETLMALDPDAQAQERTALSALLGDVHRRFADVEGVDREAHLGAAFDAYEACVGAEGDATDAARVRFARFGDSLLRGHQQQRGAGGKRARAEGPVATRPGLDAPTLAATVARELLAAVAHGSREASAQVPRVLDLLARFEPSVGPVVDEAASGMQPWVMLQWVSQLLGVLNLPSSSHLMPLLERMAQEYPQALFYAYSVTKEALTPEALQRCGRLGAILGTADDVLSKFVAALGGLTHPEHRLKDGLKEVTARLGRGDEEGARAAYVTMYEDVALTDKPHVGKLVGRYNRDFASKWGGKLRSKFGERGQKLSLAELRRFRNADELAPRSKPKEDLDRFSQWLAQFEGDAHSLEVPGQYGRVWAPPRPSMHAKIVSFGAQVLVMQSMRLPKRITIHGSDEREYMWLVKGGEDLRLDQRVQQMLQVMNGVLAADAACSQRSLRTKTYQVVPMTTSVGVIEWMQNTEPLKGILEDEMSADPEFPAKNKDARGRVSLLQTLQATVKRQQWVKGNEVPKYHKMYIGANRARAMQLFQVVQEQVPPHFLRRRIMRMTTAPESFMAVRAGFARSLAVLSVCNYLLGIGDRHLDNFLLDLRDGTVVGIDFGMAFGTGTTLLPCPELLPFRLTQQFTSLLQPLDTTGLLKTNMQHALQALRGDKEALLDAMEVFVNEPLLDWQAQAANAQPVDSPAAASSSSSTSSASAQSQDDWLPRHRVGAARAKLEGANPVAIMCGELDENKVVAHHRSLDALKAIARGVPEDNVRARLADAGLSVAEQVDALVDMATDPNILARQYLGLVTWV